MRGKGAVTVCTLAREGSIWLTLQAQFTMLSNANSANEKTAGLFALLRSGRRGDVDLGPRRGPLGPRMET